MPYKRSLKGLKLFLIIGLPAILLGPVLMYLYANNKDNPINRLVIWLSPYRALSKYLIAQAKLESANFTSNIYRKTNNPLAMGHARKRRQLGDPVPSDVFELGSTLSIQKYRNDTQGFRDMFLWYEYGKFPTRVNSAAQYVSELKKRSYFSAPEAAYLAGLTREL